VGVVVHEFRPLKRRASAAKLGSTMQTEVNRRLEALILSNLWSDLGVQVLVLGLCLWWLPSPWMWAIWAIRWGVIAGVLLGYRSIRMGLTQRAVLRLSCGHIVGVLSTVAIAPVLAPIAMLILVGDLFMASYLEQRLLRWYLKVMVIVVSLTAAFSFQSWTGLVHRAPALLVVLAIVVHTMASGVLIPRSHRQNYAALRAASERLTQSERRLQQAIREERHAITRSLNEGPVRDLDLLSQRVDEIRRTSMANRADSVRIADRSATEAQDALRSLRTISHGIFPESLQFGLSQAIGPLVAQATSVDLVNVDSTRFDSTLESAIYAAVAELTRIAQGPRSCISVVIHPTTSLLRLMVIVAAPLEGVEYDVSPLIADRIGAIGGEIRQQRTLDALSFEAIVPLATNEKSGAPPPPPPPRTPVDNSRSEKSLGSVAASNERILTVFVLSGLMIASVGLLCSVVVLLVTRTSSAAVVVLAMVGLVVGIVVSNRFVERGLFTKAVGGACVVTCTGGILLTLLIPDLAPVMGLLTSLPLLLALPHFRERVLDVIAVVQAIALTSVSLIGYADRPLVATVVPTVFPLIVVTIASAGVAAMVALTMTITTKVVADASHLVRVTLNGITDEADTQRQSMERDLHDGAQQQFVAISMQFRTLAKLLSAHPSQADELAEKLLSQLASARDDLVALANGASTPHLADGRLGDAIRAAASVSGHTVRVSADGVDQLDPDVAAAAYYCCHEALQNALKHGGASVEVDIRLRSDESYVHFEVSDNGVGFDPESIPPGRGFRSLSNRVSAVDGTFLVTSKLGEGTAVRGALPQSATGA
jgi:signal transduction histidine kinase